MNRIRQSLLRGVAVNGAALLTASAWAQPPIHHGSHEDLTIYMNVERTAQYAIGARGSAFESTPGFRASGPGRDDAEGVEVRDCSTREYDCRELGWMMFAVPRLPLSPGQEYGMGGLHYAVVKCVDLPKCSIAYVAVTCRVRDARATRCTDTPGAVDDVVLPGGPAATFIFDARYGITAFGYGGEGAPGAEGMASQYVLQGSRGLLWRSRPRQ